MVHLKRGRSQSESAGTFGVSRRVEHSVPPPFPVPLGPTSTDLKRRPWFPGCLDAFHSTKIKVWPNRLGYRRAPLQS